MESELTHSMAKRNFILQQGLQEPAPEACPTQYSALQFQPRVVGIILLLGIATQSAEIFLALAVILWWSALLHRWNPFDAIYNSVFGGRAGRPPLPPAPTPRRFSQGMAGTFALAIGVSLLLGWRTPAYVLEGMFALAASAVAIGGFCLGSFIYYLLRGQVDFARRTLPWGCGA